MTALDHELALDRIEGRIAVELPGHVRAFAAAYARGAGAPAVPPVLAQRATLATALAARRDATLAMRGLAVLQLAAPIAIEADPQVAIARAQPRTWAAYRGLQAARDAASARAFGEPHIPIMHALFGVVASPAPVADAPRVDAWTAADRACDGAAMWRALAAAHGVTGQVAIVHAAARPRAFVVVPGREVIVVVPETIATPAARFMTLHELGHAVAALADPRPLARVADEAAAARVARAMEDPASPWFSPLAAAARARRVAIAARLDAIERGGDPGTLAAPPWALWHDPGAQAAYIAAEL